MFTLGITNMENAAFADDASAEVARILREVAIAMEAGRTEGKCRDINGNTVGEWGLRMRRRRS